MIRAPLLWSLLSTLLFAGHAIAAEPSSVTGLQAAGSLQLEASLRPEGLVPGQKAALLLEVATDSWFTGGTRIRIPEVPGLVILQTEQFANNASETRAGKSWVIQRWTLDVYPQRPGRFTIPPLSVDVRVNGGTAGNLEGTLRSDPVELNVDLPPALEQLEQWVAAPDYQVSQSFDRDLSGLQVGDAFEREIRLEAEDVLAMMLPAFNEQPQAGLAAYPAPPELKDRVNRGQVQARRIERISYVVEAEGSYLLPAQDFFWWNTREQALQLLSIPALEITVGTGINAQSQGKKDFDYRLLLYPALILPLAGAGLWLLYRLLPRSPLRRLLQPARRGREMMRSLRKPALPARLNPGSSAGD